MSSQRAKGRYQALYKPNGPISQEDIKSALSRVLNSTNLTSFRNCQTLELFESAIREDNCFRELLRPYSYEIQYRRQQILLKIANLELQHRSLARTPREQLPDTIPAHCLLYFQRRPTDARYRLRLKTIVDVQYRNSAAIPLAAVRKNLP
jgi:hypothetical protein